MRSVRVIVFEELSEFPSDSDGRGAPEDQALERTQAWSERGIKIIDCSTPGEGGKTHDGKLRCRVTALYEQSSRGRYMVRCPHCQHEQDLVFERLTYRPEDPEAAYYRCVGCEEPIEHRHKKEMVARGHWVHERPELVNKHAGFAINALYSPFISWGRIARRIVDAEGDAKKEKVVSQQIRGEAYEERHDLPSEEVLYARRELWPAQVPPEVLFLEGATDVQSDRLESAVWGFDRHLTQFLIDTVVTPGKPTESETWRRHDELISRSWCSAWGREMKPVSWGIDTGYASHHVYRYCRRHAARAEPKIYALDGQGDPRLPPLSSPSKRDVAINGEKIGVVLLWPVGTYSLKIDLADALRKTEQGPDESGIWPVGAVRLNTSVSLEHVAQLTAEVLEDVLDRRQQVTGRRWRKLRANELWDLGVYARALASHDTAGMTEARWATLEAEVYRSEKPQQDMADLWAPSLAAMANAAPAPIAASGETEASSASATTGDGEIAEEATPVTRPDRRIAFERRSWFSRGGH